MVRALLLAAALAAALAAGLACSAPAPSATHPPAPPPPVPVDAGPPADAAPLARDLPRLISRSLVMYRDIAAAFTASGEDCAAATTQLHELAARDHDVVTANAAVLHDGRAAELRAALAPHSEAFDASARAIMQSPTLAHCAQDPTFAKAFDALFDAAP